MKFSKKLDKAIDKSVKDNFENIFAQALLDAEKEAEENAKIKDQSMTEVKGFLQNTIRNVLNEASVPKSLSNYEKDFVKIDHTNLRLYTRPFPGSLYFNSNIFFNIAEKLKEYQYKEDKKILEPIVKELINSIKKEPIVLYINAIINNISKIRGCVYNYIRLKDFLSEAKALLNFFTHQRSLFGDMLNPFCYWQRYIYLHEQIGIIEKFVNDYKGKAIAPYIFNRIDIDYLKKIEADYKTAFTNITNYYSTRERFNY